MKFLRKKSWAIALCCMIGLSGCGSAPVSQSSVVTTSSQNSSTVESRTEEWPTPTPTPAPEYWWDRDDVNNTLPFVVNPKGLEGKIAHWPVTHYHISEEDKKEWGIDAFRKHAKVLQNEEETDFCVWRPMFKNSEITAEWPTDVELIMKDNLTYLGGKVTEKWQNDTTSSSVTIQVEPFSLETFAKEKGLSDLYSYYIPKTFLSEVVQKFYEEEGETAYDIAVVQDTFFSGEREIYDRTDYVEHFYARLQYKKNIDGEEKVFQRYFIVRPMTGKTKKEELFVSDKGEESIREVDEEHYGCVLFDIKEEADSEEDLVVSASILDEFIQDRHFWVWNTNKREYY